MIKKKSHKEDPFTNNKGVGVVFCIISAALKITQYLTIAIYAQNRFTTSWSADDIEHYMSDYIGPALPVWSTIALIAGILFLAYGIFQDVKKK